MSSGDAACAFYWPKIVRFASCAFLFYNKLLSVAFFNSHLILLQHFIPPATATSFPQLLLYTLDRGKFTSYKYCFKNTSYKRVRGYKICHYSTSASVCHHKIEASLHIRIFKLMKVLGKSQMSALSRLPLQYGGSNLLF